MEALSDLAIAGLPSPLAFGLDRPDATPAANDAAGKSLPRKPAVGVIVSREPIEYVSRDQAAAMCRKSKDTIERWFKDDPNAPAPEIEGGGGKAHLYDYSTLRPWLEKQSGMRLPEQPPEMRP